VHHAGNITDIIRGLWPIAYVFDLLYSAEATDVIYLNHESQEEERSTPLQAPFLFHVQQYSKSHGMGMQLNQAICTKIAQLGTGADLREGRWGRSPLEK